jgi:hypothetical protein
MPQPTSAPVNVADGTRGSRAALWAWLRASGINAPLAVLFAAGDDLSAKLAELGPTPICVRLQGDRVEAPPGAKSFLVDSAASIAAVEAFARALLTFGIGEVVLSADAANGRIGLLLHRCEPLVVQVVATADDAHAQHAQLILEHDARDGYRREEDEAASAERALATAAADVGGDPVIELTRGDGHGDSADEVAAHAARRTLSLAELDWQLGKIYTSTEPGPAGAFASDSAWRKVRWVRSDSERVLRRAELAAWVVNRSLPARPAGVAYEVELALAFRPAGDLPGAVAASVSSEINEVVVVDVRPLRTAAAAALAQGGARAAITASAVGAPDQSIVAASAEAPPAAAAPANAAALEDTCKVCGALRAKTDFAKTQWKRAAVGKRSCLQCTGGKGAE